MADAVKNRVTYGLKNVHVWPITSTDITGKPTYGEVIEWPGAVSLSMDAQGSTNPFYADDTTYFNSVSNNGYSGYLSSADVPEDFQTKVLGFVKDTNGVLKENADVVPNEFAIAFEFKGDSKARRHIFFRCTAERPSVASETKQDTIAPNTPSVNITAVARLDTSDVKASCEEGDAAYATWYKTPYDGTVATES